jgi:hypothetical protein
MWSDNETTIDLLGFDYLVDSLEILLTQPNLLPVTIGVLGDWGSGKSSLLYMAEERLKESGDYITVLFSPWQYQGYEDVKAALMSAVLTEVGKHIPQEDTDKTGRLRKLQHFVGRMMRFPLAAGKSFAPTAGSIIAAHQGMPPEIGAAAGEAAVAGIEAVVEAGAETSTPESSEPSVFESVSDFRAEFKTLVTDLEDIKAVVVLIDDLDRCLDDTVIDVFEAIRLFLQVPSTAFVIAANRGIVQAAIERRYPAVRDGDPSLGKDYLEKIIQVEVVVPPLSEAEAETYLNLLFAQLRLDSTQMQQVRDTATARRRQGQFAVAMNYGIAQTALGTVGADLQNDFTIVNRIAPTLSRGLRGNPRQLKRFLNTMLLRLETAKRRSVSLDPAVLAKLMVLEQLAPKEFQQLFLWQLAQDGAPQELAFAEDKSPRKTAPDNKAELDAWLSSPYVQSWLELDPHLAGISLGEYFFFSRDRLSITAPGARLSAALQALLSRLQLSVAAQRRTAVGEAAKLPVEEYAPLYEALLERAKRGPGSEAMSSAIELAREQPASWPALAAALKDVPPADIPSSLPPRLATIGKGRAEVRGLFDHWAATGNQRLTKAVAEARKTPA